ncbi:hypothetical protein F5I97DRAFT_1799671, partial [Phlebopus sp. FC_14]
LETFAVNCVTRLLNHEMECIASYFISPPSELSEKHLMTFNFKTFIKTMTEDASLLWQMIQQVFYSDK